MDDIRKRHIEVLVSSSRQKMNMHNAAHTTMDSNSILKERYIHKDKVGSVFAYIRATVGMGFFEFRSISATSFKRKLVDKQLFLYYHHSVSFSIYNMAQPQQTSTTRAWICDEVRELNEAMQIALEYFNIPKDGDKRAARALAKRARNWSVRWVCIITTSSTLPS